ncbi:glutamine amidotransferase [Microbacterium soli]
MESAQPGRVLLAGETWVTYGVHQKGLSTYTTGGYGQGHKEFVAALEGAGWSVTHVPNHLATEEFPFTAEELSDYDVVILSDIGADTLLLHPATFERGERTPNRLAEISDWVSEGGGLLMVGGYLSFSGFGGNAGYHGTPIEQCLPVTMLGYDDRVERPDGVVPQVVKPMHPAIADLPGEWPWLLGYNRFEADRGEVLISVDSDPLLVVDAWGQGRAAAFASDCSPHWGSPAFMQWEGYATFWDRLLRWLADGRSH